MILADFIVFRKNVSPVRQSGAFCPIISARKENIMQTEYEKFISRLSGLICAAAGIKESDVIFEKKGGKYSQDGDRLLIRIGEHEKSWEVCALYAEELFSQYHGGMGMEEIVRRVVSDLKNIKKAGIYERLQTMDEYEKIKESLFIRLLNYEKNKERLTHAVYRKLGDIALVLYFKVAEEAGSITSAKINILQLQEWNKDKDEVFEAALLNTYFMTPPRVYHWEQLLMNPDYPGDNFMDLAGSHELKKNEMGNCLSTSAKTNGAVAVFLPGVAARLAQLLDSDFYMVFTSIHEVMIHNDQVVEPEDLEHVLADTIQEATPEEDYLSSKIYHYSRETEQFVCVESGEGFQEIEFPEVVVE